MIQSWSAFFRLWSIKNSRMEQHNNTEGDVFYMGARTEWLPAEHFMNINNWDESLKPSASYYIRQVEEWIASKEGLEFVETKTIPDVGVIKEEQEVNLSNPTDAIITNPVALMSKLPTRSVEKPFACNQCESSLLIIHLCVHSWEKPFACSECGKGFTFKHHLNRYLRVHSGEKPFACRQCGKAFTQKCDLNRHLRVHSREKPFSCDKCGKSFRQMGHRNVHMKRCKK